MVALAMILSYIEALIPFSFGIPGIKLGLANLVVLAALYLFGPVQALLISVVRIFLISITFGSMAALLYSLAGGLLSFAVMLMTDWRTLVCALVIFAVVFLICHIISVCALFNFAIYTFTAFTWRYLDYCGITSAVSPLPAPTLPFVFFSAFIALLIGILVIVRHKDNIIRLRNGTEKKIHAKQ